MGSSVMAPIPSRDRLAYEQDRAQQKRNALAEILNPLTYAPLPVVSMPANALATYLREGAGRVASDLAMNAATSLVGRYGGAMRDVVKYGGKRWRDKATRPRRTEDVPEFQGEGLDPQKYPHHSQVYDVVRAIREAGFLPNVDVDRGGSVYVTASVPVLTKKGEISRAKAPYDLLDDYRDPAKFRVADHGQFWGATMSIDPRSGNTPQTVADWLAYRLKRGPRPFVGESMIDPSGFSDESGTLDYGPKPRFR